MRAWMKVTGVAVALAALISLGGAFTRPTAPSLSTTITGDAELAARARPLLAGALDRASIAVVDASTVTYANFVLLTTMGTLRIFDMMWIMTQGTNLSSAAAGRSPR